MKRLLFAGVAAFTVSLLPAAGHAQGTVKIGLIMPYSGQFADAATQMDDGVKLYLKQHGDKLGGMNVEIIRKDTGGINPAVAKRLAQELVTRDNVDIFAGFVLTPNALAAADISVEAKKFMVVMNAATAIITTKSPYMVRTSLTVPQLTQTLGTWAEKNGLKKAYTMVTDYGPGIDAEDAFQKGFKEAGGDVVGSVRMAVQNPDFTAYVQRAKDLNPQGIFVMIPGGAQPGAFGKALAEVGIDPKKTEVMGQLEIADERALASMGDVAEGIITAAHYDYNHKSKLNEEFVQDYNADFKRNPDFFSVGGYDGMHAIDAALKKSGDKTDGEVAGQRRQGLELGKPARSDLDRSGNARHRSDRLYQQGREGRRPSGQRADRRDPERQGPRESGDEEVMRR